MPPTAWFIRPHLWWSRCTTPRSYSDQDVLRLLGSTDPAPEERSRAEAVRACAARPASWMDRLDAAETRELGRLVPRLPTIVFWYYVGVPVDEIGCLLDTSKVPGRPSGRFASSVAASHGN